MYRVNKNKINLHYSFADIARKEVNVAIKLVYHPQLIKLEVKVTQPA